MDEKPVDAEGAAFVKQEQGSDDVAGHRMVVAVSPDDDTEHTP